MLLNDLREMVREQAAGGSGSGGTLRSTMIDDEVALAEEWTRINAPVTGDVRAELVHEAAEFLGIPVEESWLRLGGATARFREEWEDRVANSNDPEALIEFYNQSDTELFELIEWHATDPIHYRTLAIRDLALNRTGRQYLDYGSGIGSDAMVFAECGFDITLADISSPLLAFAEWRLVRRGFKVRAIDLKHEALPANSFDMAVCFDVLEHIPDPIPVVRAIRDSLRVSGLLALHAPFGKDAKRPMHVVHQDIVTPRLQALGFQLFYCSFPRCVWAPMVCEKQTRSAIKRARDLVYEKCVKNAFGSRLVDFCRRTWWRHLPAASLADRERRN
jgi:2-polyprenyl-3-methyl-5-hydroxy-6-metoxy-1,4-benzoquinol methylase